MEVRHSFVEALTRNWWLKLLAFALAIAVYYSMKPAGAGVREPKHNDRNFFQEPR